MTRENKMTQEEKMLWKKYFRLGNNRLNYIKKLDEIFQEIERNFDLTGNINSELKAEFESLEVRINVSEILMEVTQQKMAKLNPNYHLN
jgi:hypothetical protein